MQEEIEKAIQKESIRQKLLHAQSERNPELDTSHTA